MQLREMSDDDCIEFLGNHTFGHLGCNGEQYPYLVPIHYAYEGRRLFMFSMPGLKIDRLRANPLASFQAEELHQDRRWKSVLVQGRFEELTDNPQRRNERIHAWSLLEKRVLWWEPGSFTFGSDTDGTSEGPIFLSLSIELLSGRQTI
ncbi:putative flavin-nucleotide-binding protein [Rhizobium leguminosarum bv. trifolii WSM2297]|uniref:Putative flavin-nucleotide-binding protein n=1 Tax=Rhizobium leguminosarum bv. trifolii WSM2297 TaxID=754762 RepID=J0L218_RHILT|nr:pyridoxamine 5'-phosphate oxidase family protein [Rhizobium leguminosarum]EJC84224.1 putative flavin-nucleotide-binding protein [Rhizobium leguminosarum bv. trifolii WSM2297]